MAISGRTRPSFNPFAWGTLFFTFWLTLMAVPDIGTPQKVMAWAFLGLSCFLWLATFIPPLDKPIGAPISQQTILPLVFLASVFTWIMGSITALPQVPKSLQIIVPVGIVLWMVAYMAIFIWSFRHDRIGTLLGIVTSAFFIVRGVIFLFQAATPIQSWVLIALGVALLIITLLKSKIGRIFPLV